MAKKFMYVCIGIMALAVAFHLGAKYGQASYVDHSTGGIIALLDTNMDYPVVLLDSGEIWAYEFGAHMWVLSPDTQKLGPCPIPVSQIKFINNWDAEWFISTSNELWYRTDGLIWVNAGSPSGGVGAQPTTWGAIKAKWEE